ncbi:MAG: DUF4230 domain-containing protein [Verrucomicrobiota bacterium]
MKHYLGACMVLLTAAAICLVALRACVASVDETVDHVRDAFAKVLQLQPQVTVNQQVILSQTAPIAELAVVTKDELVTIGLNSHYEVLSWTVPLTEKSLTVEAVFRMKAGFDLRQPFTVTLDPVTHAVKATLPHATILSVEQVGPVNYKGESALLNGVTDVDTTQILSSLAAAARAAAENSGLKQDAESQVSQRLTDLMRHNGQAMAIQWSGPAGPRSRCRNGLPIAARNLYGKQETNCRRSFLLIFISIPLSFISFRIQLSKAAEFPKKNSGMPLAYTIRN